MKTGSSLYLRSLSIVGFAALLTGCTTATQRQDQAMTTTPQSATQQLHACLQTVYYSSEYEPLRARMPLNMSDETLLQVSDASLATDDEIRTILRTHPKVQACRNGYLNQINQTTPTIAAIVAEGYTKLESSLIDLIQKKQSWGEHLRRTRAISVASQSRLASEDRRILEGLRQSNDAELAGPQAAAAAFLDYQETQQIINNINLPFVTN